MTVSVFGTVPALRSGMKNAAARPGHEPYPAALISRSAAARASAVICDQRRLSEVRICLSKDLQFRACEEIDRRACRREQVVMPPVRGG